MTAAERFQKSGSIQQISKERFNRYKGIEWYFEPRDIDGQRMVLGYIGSYPDAPESNFSGIYYTMPYEDFCTAWDTFPERNIWRLGTALLAAGAEEVSCERYQAMLRTGTAVPRCEHCRQMVL